MNNFPSKLPHVGTTIFTVMSQLANQENAVNLSQGFPDFETSPKLIDWVYQYMKAGHNQYAPMFGIQSLREEIVKKMEDIHNVVYHPENEINITTGGSEAIFSALGAILNAGDEVIIFEPAFDLYRPVIELFGGIVKAVHLKAPYFEIDWNEVRNLITEKTKLILINNPNNPATYTFSHEDFTSLEQITDDTNILILSDEVYEHMVFDEEKFISICRYPNLKERSMLVASFGKLFHITGWKVGYILAPEWLMKEIRKVHQYNVFSVFTAAQFALADFMKDKNEYLSLPQFFQAKRDYLMDGLAQTPLKLIKPKGSYYLVADYSDVSDENDVEFAKWLTREFKVATVPFSAFYENSPDQKLVRICFAKKQETLDRAIENLSKLK